VSLKLSHIPYERLVDWAEGRLAPDQQATIAAHLATCTRCRAEAERVERMVNAMRADDSRDAPPAVLARAVQLFRTRAVTPAPSLVQRIVAALRFESTPLTPAFGLRGESAAVRQLIYTAGDSAIDIDLRIAPAAGGWQVSGQLLGDDLGPGVARLHGAAFSAEAPIDALSTFALPPAPAAVYTLTLTWPTLAIAVEELVLGTP
jgi:anti-sigma factor RsiW